MVVKFEYWLGWNNWTFGVWWGRFGKKTTNYTSKPFHFGIDIGPLELMWSRKKSA